MSANQFKGLPIEDLIAGPLIASAQAQGKLAGVTTDFIQSVGMEEGANGASRKARTVDFSFQRPVNNEDGSVASETANLSVPLLSIVNVPNLSITEANVNFNMEVKSATVDKSEKAASATVSASYKSWYSPVKASFSGTVSTKNQSTRTTDNTAKYEINVKAQDKGTPEGLLKVLDMLNASIAPTNPSASAASAE